MYENLAKDISFPCYNAEHGCPEVLIPKDVSEHEAKCQYTQYRCPLEFDSTVCCPKATVNVLMLHLEQMHKCQVIYDWRFPLSFAFQYDKKFIMMFQGNVFVVDRMWKKESKFYIGVGMLGPKSLAEKYFVELKLFSSGCDSYIAPRKNVYACNDRIKVDESYFTIIDKEFVEKFDDCSSIECKIRLTNAITEEKASDGQMEIEIANASQQFLSDIECPVCFEHMRPPIYICSSGHSVCGPCKIKITVCPTCRQSMLNARNFSLEGVSGKLQHHCKHHNLGCNEIALLTSLLVHEENCTFKPYKCPLWEHTETKCDWDGNTSEILDHIEDKHRQFIMQTHTIKINKPQNQPSQNGYKLYRRCEILEKFGNIFRILSYWLNSQFYFCVQFVGPTKQCKHFTYTLNFFDELKLQRMIFKLVCAPYQEEKITFAANNPFLQIPLNLWKTVANDDTNENISFQLHLEMEKEIPSD